MDQVYSEVCLSLHLDEDRSSYSQEKAMTEVFEKAWQARGTFLCMFELRPCDNEDRADVSKITCLVFSLSCWWKVQAATETFSGNVEFPNLHLCDDQSWEHHWFAPSVLFIIYRSAASFQEDRFNRIWLCGVFLWKSVEVFLLMNNFLLQKRKPPDHPGGATKFY